MTKVSFDLPQKTKIVELPSYPGSQVEVKTSFTIGENRAILEKFPNASDPKHPDAIAFWFEMVRQAIVAWNFTYKNEAGEEVDLPITEDALRKLSIDDFTALQQNITSEFEKKKQ